MAKISYVNGSYVHHADAMVHMEDRGYQFSDGIYEVMAFYNRRFLDADLHLKRLQRSLNELRIDMPMSLKVMRLVMRELIRKNDRDNGTLYMQITRGVARRDHPFPKTSRPGFVMAVTGPKGAKESEIKNGARVITHPDERWARRDIKSISLLPNVLAKQAATEAGAREAWLTKDNLIIEGSSSNNAIINDRNEIITSPADHNILGGITREVVLALAKKDGFKIVERSFSVNEAKKAKEAFLMSTTLNVLPVTEIDGIAIGNGKPGKVTLRLLELYRDHITRQTGKQW